MKGSDTVLSSSVVYTTVLISDLAQWQGHDFISFFHPNIKDFASFYTDRHCIIPVPSQHPLLCDSKQYSLVPVRSNSSFFLFLCFSIWKCQNKKQSFRCSNKGFFWYGKALETVNFENPLVIKQTVLCSMYSVRLQKH